MRVVELPLKMPEMACINVFFWLFWLFVIAFLAGELGPDTPSSEVETMPSSLSTSEAELRARLGLGSDFVGFGGCLLLAFLATGIPNLAGSVRGVAGKDMGGSVAARVRLVKGVVVVATSSVGIGGMDEDGTATRVLRVLGRLPELLRIMLCTTLLCFFFKELNLARRSRGFCSL